MRRLGMVFLAILLLFMIFAGPVVQNTDAVVVSTVVIGAVIAAMAAAGIGLTVSGMTSAQLQDWVSGKLNDWATSLGGTVQDHIDASEITATGRGFLSLGTLAANGISQFISWLKIQDNITDNSQVTVVQGNTLINGIEVGILPTAAMRDNYNYTYQYESVDSTTLYCYYQTSQPNTGVLVFSLDDTASGYNFYFNGSLYQTYSFNSRSNGYAFYSGQKFGPAPPYWDNYYPNIEYSGNPYTVFGANPMVTQNGSLAYDTDVITVPTIATGDKWFLDVGAEPGATVQTATDGVIADTIDGTLTVSGEVAEEEPEFEVTGPIGVSGLTEIFPFCIPFDVYALLSCLSAEPQTPVFTVRFVIPGVINQEFTIDLSPFSTIAQIVRTMELIAFAIGLALVTRERFLRS